jgi:4-amino-4-deoxy-L-arabinose transferase-like glycosyltransferase
VSVRDRATRAPSLGLVTAGLWLLFAFNLGSLPLTDPDEGRYAEIAREMLASGDWTEPRLFGIPYLEKPPLLYWLTALSLRALGKSETAARLVPSMAAAAGVLAVGAFASRTFGSSAGILAATVLGTSVLYVALARAVVTDMLFSTGLSIALLAFLRARVRDDARAFALAWLGLAIAVLAKGPAAIVLCLLVVSVDSALGRSWSWLVSRTFWLTLPVFLAIALPWFVAIQIRRPEFFSFYLWKEHLNRVAGSEHPHPFYFYVPILLAGFLPWTPLAAAAAKSWCRAARESTPDAAVVRFLLVWSVVVFVVFSVSVGKLATYILPVLCPLAILLGRTLAERPTRTAYGIAGLAVVCYVATTFVEPLFAARFTPHPQIVELAARLREGDELAMFGGYFPSVAFYLERPPLLVGVRQELRLGKSLEAGGLFVGDLAGLREAAPHGTLYLLTDVRAKRADELRSALGSVELVSRNDEAALWMSPPAVSVSDGASSLGNREALRQDRQER